MWWTSPEQLGGGFVVAPPPAPLQPAGQIVNELGGLGGDPTGTDPTGGDPTADPPAAEVAGGVIHVVGLGPAGPDLVTAGTLDVIASTPHRYLRTDWHPAASVVPDAATFDHLYDTADTFDEVYRTIVDELVDAAGTAAAAGASVLYAVPGSPVVAEHTVELLLVDPRVEVGRCTRRCRSST